MACSSGCYSKSHRSYAECMKSKSLRVSTIDVSAQKKADSTLDKYEQARREGIQPNSTRKHDIETAMKISDTTGVAFQA